MTVHIKEEIIFIVIQVSKVLYNDEKKKQQKKPQNSNKKAQQKPNQQPKLLFAQHIITTAS